ncbi:MAG: hypothetical protein WEA61_09335 [Anaerolineales bacterium]
MNAITLYDPQVHLAQSKQAKNLMHLGGREGWPFVILGIAPLPKEPIYLSKWEIVPAHLDSSPIPSRTLERIQTIYAEGIRPKGFVLVHELPNQIPASVPDVVEGEFVVRPNYEFTLEIGKIVGTGLKVIGAVALAAVTVAGVVLPAVFAVGSALLLDPILVAVTEDDVWIEIDRWLE